jgi:ATP-dependent Lon protease
MTQSNEDLSFDPDEFCGRARLFPLPNLVLFPHVIQPLHVFEPRYVELLEDALQDDRLIAMALLQPGWEPNYEGRPPVAPVACLGRVLTWQSAPQKRYNLLLVGLRRARIVNELPPERSFREAEVQLLEDEFPAGGSAKRAQLYAALSDAFEQLLPAVDESSELSQQVAGKTISLAALTDVISYALDIDVVAKQSLLEELDVDKRANFLLHHLQGLAKGACKKTLKDGFPPAFSAN